MGFVTKLFLKPDAVPSIKTPSTGQPVSLPSNVTSAAATQTRDVGCQWEPQKRGRATVATQLSEYTLKSIRSKAIQVNPSTSSFGTNTEVKAEFGGFTSTPDKTRPPPLKRRRLETLLDDTEDLDDSEEEPVDRSQSTYHPSMSSLSDSTIVSPPTPIQDIVKYVVYEDCLLALFHDCPICQRTCELEKYFRGTFLSIRQKCPFCDYSRQWKSQPIIGSTPAGDLQLSAAVHFTGTSFRQISKVLSALKVCNIVESTYFLHASSFMEPCVFAVWKRTQADLIQETKSRPGGAELGGDMRADSPGHCAKYGSYSMMDLNTGKIIDVQLVQSNECGGSAKMEKEGLIRSLDFLEKSAVKVASIVTDRHSQIQKFLRIERNDIEHFYDVWHVAKGVSKKVEALAKMKDCDELKRWQQSLVNHLYWCAISSSSGEEAVAKWTSFSNHVQNIHSHDNVLFPECLHPALDGSRPKKWLKSASTALFKLQRIVSNKYLLKGVAKLSPRHQTSAIEGFHSVILRFAPKNVVFSYRGMLCRLYLASLHFNENGNREQLTSRDGTPAYKIKYPKHKKGKHTIQPLKKKPSYAYVDNLMRVFFDEVLHEPAKFTVELQELNIPDTLCSQFHRPDKQEAVAAYVSRFSH
ncbi:uncharacterized protein LOC143718542 [Siphateles boraxobius]|uniref:uncharacterized protein LOC143718542 n=2 Tax=Siphateles boraxobius TaxID=180520 RepID=UPI004064C71A